MQYEVDCVAPSEQLPNMANSSSVVDEIKHISWTPFSVDGKQYFVKYLFSEKSYCLMILDLVHLYLEEMDESEIQQRCENLNPGIEMPLERMIKQIKNSLEDCLKPGGPCNIRNMITVSKQSHQHLEIKVVFCVAEVMFVWFFTLNSMGSSCVSSHLLMPLIGMCTELKRRHRELIQVIKHKDEEIEDYKMNGAKVTRKRLETKPFVESDFVADMDRSKYFLESLKESAETALTDRLYSAVVVAQENLKRKAEEIEENKKSKVAKEVNNQQKSELKEVPNEDSGFENRKEEMQRRMLLEQQLTMKTERKRKKKTLNL